MFDDYAYLLREPSVDDVRRYLNEQMTDPDEVDWLLRGCDRNPWLDLLLRFLTADQLQEELDDGEPDPVWKRPKSPRASTPEIRIFNRDRDCGIKLRNR